MTRFFAILFLSIACVGCEPTRTSPPEKPVVKTRIISLAPNVTEILFAVGVGDDVVGVTKFCNFPAEVEKLPNVGGLVDPNFERLLSLEPTKIVGVETKHTKKIEAAIGDRAELLWVKVETLPDVYKAIEKIGTFVDRSDNANRVVADLKNGLSPEKMGDASGIVVFGTDPYIAAGPTTFADSLLQLAGVKNAVAPDAPAYVNLDLEQLIVLNPTFVIDASMGDSTFPDALPAQKNGRVHRMPNVDLMRPGPRLGEALKFFKSVSK